MAIRTLRNRTTAATCALSVLLLVLTMTGCSSDKHRTAVTTTTAAAQQTTTSVEVSGSERYVFGATKYLRTGPGATRPTAAADRAMRVFAKQYLHNAMWLPLTAHTATKAWSNNFDAGIRTQAISNDAAVLNDPAAGYTIRSLDATIAMRVLLDDNGHAASAVITIHATASGESTIRRSGELLLLPSFGNWAIAGYDITVTRTAADGGAATTTSAKTTAKS